jgi:hypothetical protein
VKVSVLSIWEQLGSLEGWSELAASCDASPFVWPCICVPWWYEAGWGGLRAVLVEESGLPVGLALVHDQSSRFGRHGLRQLGEEQGAYWQLLVADGRKDIETMLWDHLLEPGWPIELRGVPAALAEQSAELTAGAVTASRRAVSGFCQVELAGDDRPDCGSVRTVTDPEECLDLVLATEAGDPWGVGALTSRRASFVASAVDAAARTGRLTLHVETRFNGPSSGVLVLHGAGTAAVWRWAGESPPGTEPELVEAVSAEAARRGATRIVWPDGAGVPGSPFPLSDLSRAAPGGSSWQRVAESTRRALRSYHAPS